MSGCNDMINKGFSAKKFGNTNKNKELVFPFQKLYCYFNQACRIKL